MELEQLNENIEKIKTENENLQKIIENMKTENEAFKNEFKTFRETTTKIVNGGIEGTQDTTIIDINKTVKEILNIK